jgi:hypothetical protein
LADKLTITQKILPTILPFGSFADSKAVLISDSKQLSNNPEPEPSRNETIGQFIDWAKSRPQHWKETPVEMESGS